MNDFTTVTLTQKPLDPFDRVHYSTGMVLGADEFVQEQLYLMESDRLHNRSLHGYGTICGLDVRYDPKTRMVVVTSGLAVDPAGQKIRVPLTQCADLDKWLTRNKDDVLARTGSPPGTFALPLFVALSYRECETGIVPVPGKPCRTGEESMAPSRISDDFELSLSFDAPKQVEEEAVKRFRELLNRVEVVTDGAGPFITRKQMEDCVRRLNEDIMSPPLGSPPCFDILRVPSSEACDILNAGFRVWVTEVRPALLGDAENCPCESPVERKILLAELRFNVKEEGGSLKAKGEVSVIADDRPLLLHTRLLQDMICGQHSRVHDHGDLSGLNADDHTMYLLADGGRQLTSNWDVGNKQIRKLAAATSAGDAVRYEQTVKVGDIPSPTTSDLAGHYPNPTIAKLQGRPVTITAPFSNKQVLAWDGSKWTNKDRMLDDLKDVNVPAPQNGQVLTWNSTTQLWEARPPDTSAQVYAPAGLYVIVAAGYFESTGTPTGLVYNGLSAKPLPLPSPAGDYLLHFAHYKSPLDPKSTHMYIVKGTVEDSVSAATERITFQFVEFLPKGIRVRILNAAKKAVRQGFMVEISAYGTKVP